MPGWRSNGWWGISAGDVVVPGGYVGPADLTGWQNPYAYWGLRAMSADYAAAEGPCIDICKLDGTATTTIYVTTDGDLDVVSIAGWQAVNGSAFAIKKVYNQVAGGQNLLPNTPVPFLLAGLGAHAKPCFKHDAAAEQSIFYSENPVAAHAAPFTVGMSFAASTLATGGCLWSAKGNYGGSDLFHLSGGLMRLEGGVGNINMEAAIEANAWYSMTSVINGASSLQRFNEVEYAASSDIGSSPLGDTAPSGDGRFCVFSAAMNPSSPLSGMWSEIIVQTGAANTGERGAFIANQRAYFGF